MPLELIKEELLAYCRTHSSQDSHILTELENYTLDNEEVPQMLSGQLVGNFLQSIIIMQKVKYIVEVGTFTGYSALKMAEILPDDGEIHTCEIMKKHIILTPKATNIPLGDVLLFFSVVALNTGGVC